MLHQSRALWVVLSLLGCSRATTPPPTAETTSPPAPSAAASVVASDSPATAPATSLAAPPATSVAAPLASTEAAPPVKAANECARFEQSPEYRNLPPEARTRSRVSCEAKQEFSEFVATRQACSTAHDCRIVTGACPFECYVPVATNAVPEVKQKLGELGDRLRRAGQRCVYRCMNQPSEACVEGRCTIGR